MNIALWILQVILAIKLFTVTLDHGLIPTKPGIRDARQKMGRSGGWWLGLAAAGSLLGALGLLLPGLLGLDGRIISYAALGVVGLLALSIPLHLRSREKPKIFVSLVLAAFALFVAYGRW